MPKVNIDNAIKILRIPNTLIDNNILADLIEELRDENKRQAAAIAAIEKAWTNMRGDIKHHWSCKLLESSMNKCTCGGWELIEALEALTGPADPSDREQKKG